jgi:NTP pyrophosphatase (non-canonical NTP hydrolase)
MTLDEYQEQAKTTAIPLGDKGLFYASLGLSAEAGEVANKVKKILRDDNGVLSDEKREAIASELGDVLWYAADLATELGVKLEDVAEQNLSKLKSRQERGQLQGSGDNR